MFTASLMGRQQVATYTFKLAHGKCLLLDKPQVMGIVNLGPDSYASKTRFTDSARAVEFACQLAAEGASIIDIGAEPTNPSLNEPRTSEAFELERLLPVVEQVVKRVDIPISIDTSKPKVMQACIESGAHMINDVRGLQLPGALETAARLNAGICLMHMRYPDGVPKAGLTFDDPHWLNQIKNFLAQRIAACLQEGLKVEQIMIDPGVGFGSFGKNTAQNCQLLQNLAYFQDLGHPLLISASRKTFIGDILGAAEDQRIAGSLATATIAALQGAHIIRAHDVKETVDAVQVARAIINEGK